jgi:hypothetical protein
MEEWEVEWRSDGGWAKGAPRQPRLARAFSHGEGGTCLSFLCSDKAASVNSGYANRPVIYSGESVIFGW